MIQIAKACLAGLTLAAAVSSAAIAGSFRDAEAELRDVYGDYRAALFQSNAGNAAAVAAALDEAQRKWAALRQQWGADVPPQYADDPELGTTLNFVAVTLQQAAEIAASGDLAAAHEELEAIRDAIGDLHLRNGLIGFSDRMNAYHEEMEKVLALDAAALTEADIPAVQEHAAVLVYLAGQIGAHPAPEAEQEGYAPLVAAMQNSADALLAAARGGDPDQVRAALAALKPAYAKLFAKFG